MRKVFVYYNLHKHKWSVKDVKTGRVIGHHYDVSLYNAKFKVSEAGRTRVLKEKRKNVHAYIQGREGWNEEEQRWQHIGPDCTWIIDSVGITYNPYKNNTFIRTDTGEEVHKAKLVVFGCGKMGKEVRAIL